MSLASPKGDADLQNEQVGSKASRGAGGVRSGKPSRRAPARSSGPRIFKKAPDLQNEPADLQKRAADLQKEPADLQKELRLKSKLAENQKIQQSVPLTIYMCSYCFLHAGYA